jgi:hypothetical protein
VAELMRHPPRVFVLMCDGFFRVNPRWHGENWRLAWDDDLAAFVLSFGVQDGSAWDLDPFEGARRLLAGIAGVSAAVRPGMDPARIFPDVKGQASWHVVVDLTAPPHAEAFARAAKYRQPFGRRKIVYACGGVWG